jgi:hypothetical protein
MEESINTTTCCNFSVFDFGGKNLKVKLRYESKIDFYFPGKRVKFQKKKILENSMLLYLSQFYSIQKTQK